MATYIKRQTIDVRCVPLGAVSYWARKLQITLLVVALLGAFSAQLITANAYDTIATYYDSRDEIRGAAMEDYTPWEIRIAIYAALVCGILAGTMYLFSGGWTSVGVGARLAFVVMVVWMVAHAIATFYEVPPIPAELRGAKGPLVWVSCVILFAGTDKRAWRVFCRLIYIFAYLTAGIVLLNILSFGRFFSQFQAVWFFRGYLHILLWTAPWILLTIKDAEIPLSRLAVRAFPFAVLCLACFLSTGRSWTIIAMLYTVVVLLKFRKLLQGKPLMKYLLVVCILLLMVMGLRLFSGQIHSSFFLLSERLWTDTRTGQLVEFFSQVSIRDLVIGTGPRGTWWWDGQDYPYIDGSYILMAFNGGLPLLVSYLVIMVLPALRVLRTRPSWDYVAPAVVLLFWALALTGLSTYTNPTVSIEHYILCIYAGRCLSYLYNRRNRLSPSSVQIPS